MFRETISEAVLRRLQDFNYYDSKLLHTNQYDLIQMIKIPNQDVFVYFYKYEYDQRAENLSKIFAMGYEKVICCNVLGRCFLS